MITWNKGVEVNISVTGLAIRKLNALSSIEQMPVYIKVASNENAKGRDRYASS